MPSIICRNPFFPHATSLRVPGGPAIEIKRDQIIIWVGLVSTANTEAPQFELAFPALIDSGFNGDFILREQHLRDWAKIVPNPDDFPTLGSVKAHGLDVPRYDADLWIFPNVPGFRDQLASSPPHRLEIDTGVMVFPTAAAQVRLLLLGLRALRRINLRLLVNGAKRHVSLRSPLV